MRASRVHLLGERAFLFHDEVTQTCPRYLVWFTYPLSSRSSWEPSNALSQCGRGCSEIFRERKRVTRLLFTLASGECLLVFMEFQ
jgi:hypothetical protein